MHAPFWWSQVGSDKGSLVLKILVSFSCLSSHQPCNLLPSFSYQQRCGGWLCNEAVMYQSGVRNVAIILKVRYVFPIDSYSYHLANKSFVFWMCNTYLNGGEFRYVFDAFHSVCPQPISSIWIVVTRFGFCPWLECYWIHIGLILLRCLCICWGLETAACLFGKVLNFSTGFEIFSQMCLFRIGVNRRKRRLHFELWIRQFLERKYLQRQG